LRVFDEYNLGVDEIFVYAGTGQRLVDTKKPGSSDTTVDELTSSVKSAKKI